MKDSSVVRVPAFDLTNPKWRATLAGAGDMFYGAPSDVAIIGRRAVRGGRAVDLGTGDSVSWNAGADVAYFQEGEQLISAESRGQLTTYSSIDPDDGSMRWHRSVTDDMHAVFVNGVLVYWQDDSAHAIDLATGTERWQTPSTYRDETGYSDQLPAASGLLVIPDASGKHVQTVDIETGAARFRMTADYWSGLVVAADGIAVLTYDGIAMLDANTGAVEWTHQVDTSGSRLLVVGDRIVVTTPARGVQLSSVDLGR